MTEQEAARLRRELAAAMASGKVRMMTPLPWHIRVLLAFGRRRDATACWLARHHCERAAVAVWRVFGAW